MSIIQNNWHKSWNNFFNEQNIEKIKEIENKINKNFYPIESKVLKFTENDLKKIKYIILGMDPYPSDYIKNGIITPEATGRSFEVDSLNNWNQKFKQSSLRNIVKTIYYNKYNKKISMDEIRELINEDKFKLKQPKEWFNSLEEQGVLFLNASLTVEPGKPDSHRKYWNDFMDSLIEYINENSDAKWCVWGDKAYNRIKNIVNQENIIKSSHPRVDKFVLENCFQYMKDINWLG